MSKFNAKFFIIQLFLILFVSAMSFTCNAAVTTTTAGAATSSTSGMYFPPQKNIDQSFKAVLPQSGPIITNPENSNLVCVDSGVQGRRCGIMGVTFCKLNPDAQNCKAFLENIR